METRKIFEENTVIYLFLCWKAFNINSYEGTLKPMLVSHFFYYSDSVLTVWTKHNRSREKWPTYILYTAHNLNF